MGDGQWLAAGNVAELGPGEMKGVAVGAAAVAVYNIDGALFATSNICTHAFTFLSDGWLDGKIIECPLHGGRFDVTTGKGQGAPIACDLATFPLRVVGDRIEVYIESQAGRTPAP